MNKFEYKRLFPFKWFVLQNFPFIEADFDAITNYQLYCKIVEYLNKTLENVNVIGTELEQLVNAFNNLQDYVNNYFENLDVQEEINNKLDEMAEAGTLTELITAYLNLKCILAFNTISDMANATNLIDGSYVKTYGRNTLNDGGGAFYYVRPIENTDVVDGINIVALSDASLVAVKVTEIEKTKILSQLIDTKVYGQIYTNDIGKSSQSFIMHDNFLISAGSGNDANTGFLNKISLTTGERILLQDNLNIGHANGMCYCDKDEFIYIACSGGSNGLPQISVYNTDLQFIRNIDFTNIGSGSAWGIAYNSQKDVFYVLSGNQILEMNYALDTIINSKNMELNDVEIVGQSLYCDDSYIFKVYNIPNEIDSYLSYSRIDVYDINTLEYVTTQKTSITGEVECGYCYNGYTYFMKITQNTGIIYKSSNYENTKIFDYIDKNIIYNKQFPVSNTSYDVYINSSYTNFYSDGSEEHPFWNLWVTQGLLKDIPVNNIILHLTGDFSNFDFNVRHLNKNLQIIGTSNTNFAKIGGININSSELVNIENIEIVKRSGGRNYLISAINVKKLTLNNIRFNGTGSENGGLYADNTFVRISNLYIENSFTNNNQAINIENGASLFMSGAYTSSVSDASVTANTKGIIHLPYRFPINMASSNTDWNTNIIGGGISFYLRDIKLPGNYRIESGNTCQDAPSGYTTNSGRIIVEFVSDVYIYKFIPMNTNKLFVGVRSGTESNITWTTVI